MLSALGREGGSAGGLAACFALVSVGYGCHLSYPLFGSLGQVWSADSPPGAVAALMAMLMYAAMIAGRLGLAGLGTRGLLRQPRGLWTSVLAVMACYGAALLCRALDAGPAAQCALSLALGLAAAYPSIAWVEALFLLYDRFGAQWCLASVAAAHIVSRALASAAGVIGGGAGAMVAAVLACLAVSLLCALLLARAPAPSPPGQKPPPAPSKARPGWDRGRLFAPPAHLGYTVLALGVVWSLSPALSDGLGAEGAGGAPTALAELAGCAVTSALAIALVIRERGDLRFGGVLRWAVALTGVSWAVLPALGSRSPVAACALSASIYTVQGMLVPYLVVGIAHGRGLGVCPVAAGCLAFYSGGFLLAQAAALVCDLFLGPDASAGAISALSVALLFSVVPLLPGRRADAYALAFDGYLRDEGVGASLEQARQAVAARCGLTPREAEVMGLLLRGRTREEIAADLGISPWTVKGHVARVYEKTGAHSAASLMSLVAGRAR